MAFKNSIVAGEALVRTGIRSPDYVAGVAGWRIARDGTAEFNNVTVRGEFIAGTYPAGPYARLTPDVTATPDVSPGLELKSPSGESGVIYRPAAGATWIVSTDGIILWSIDQVVSVTGAHLNVDQYVLLDALGTDGDPARAAQGWFGGPLTADGGAIDSPAAQTYKTSGGRAGPLAASGAGSGNYYEITDAFFPNELIGANVNCIANGTPVFVTFNGAGSPISDKTGLRFRAWNAATGAQFTGSLTVLWTAIGY